MNINKELWEKAIAIESNELMKSKKLSNMRGYEVEILLVPVYAEQHAEDGCRIGMLTHSTILNTYNNLVRDLK